MAARAYWRAAGGADALEWEKAIGKLLSVPRMTEDVRIRSIAAALRLLALRRFGRDTSSIELLPMPKCLRRLEWELRRLQSGSQATDQPPPLGVGIRQVSPVDEDALLEPGAPDNAQSAAI